MVSYFPEYQHSEQIEQITIEHLLTQSCGFAWNEFQYPYEDDRNIFNKWIQSGNRTAYILAQPVVRTPGWKFNYNTAASHLVTAVLQRATGQSAQEFAQENLFSPLGIEAEHVYWPTDEQGVNIAGNLHLTSSDLAKIGYLVLQKGIWNNKPVVSQEWLDASFEPHQHVSYSVGFGYHWWLRTIAGFSVYAAEGYKEQRLYIIPELDMVVVMTGNVLAATDHAAKLLELILQK